MNLKSSFENAHSFPPFISMYKGMVHLPITHYTEKVKGGRMNKKRKEKEEKRKKLN